MTQISKSYFHRGGDTPLLGSTIPEHFAQIVDRFGDCEAVVSMHQNRRLTYAAFAEQVDQLARGLVALGFNRGDRVGIWSTNNIEWLLLQMATARVGIVLVNINPSYKPKELAYSLNRSELQGLFMIPAFRDNDYVQRVLELIPELSGCRSSGLQSSAFPNLRRVVIFDPHNPDNTPRPQQGFTTWWEVQLAAASVTTAQIDDITRVLDIDDAINIQYTSGTTGFPKAVVLSHHNILNNAWFTAQIMRFAEEDRLCVPVPLYHCFGIVLASLLCFSVGACVVMPSEYFDPLSVLQVIDRERCTAVHGVPTMFIGQLECPEFADFDLSSLRTGIMAGAPCPPDLMTRVMADMHCREILIGYGETEASPLTHLTSPEDSFDRRINTVGKNLPHQEVKIVNTETNQIVALGDIGEICFRGHHIMKGYYADPDATRKALDENGWLYSGDLGVMDAEGYVQITGRRKEMIIRGGENIYPAEIEEFIFTHPKVAQVAVFGMPDDYYGEVVGAWIQLHQGETATADEIREYCDGNLAYFKIPVYLRVVDRFPLTVTGKVQKFRMRELEIEMQKASVA